MKKLPNGVSNFEELMTENYYYVDKSLYNDKYQLLIDNLNIDLSSAMKNGFLIISQNHVIDIRTRRYMNISFLDAYKDYTAFISGGSYLIYDHEHETWISYKNYQQLLNGAHFYNDDKSLYISTEKGKVSSLKELIDPEHLLDEYSIDSNLSVTRKSDNKDILKGPLEHFYVSNNKQIQYFDTNVEAVAVFNGKVVKVKPSHIVGDYLVNDEEIFNSQGEKVDVKCSNNTIFYIGEHYWCKTTLHKMLDSSLKPITEYNSIECIDNNCSVEDSGLYGIYSKNKELVKPVYKSIDLRKDYYIGVINDKTFELVRYKDIKDN